ncbi:metallophosphoesterase 1-like, partial [Ctenocephalides felis]|uniref:metallophosphoesterase 1-like n=1 Tax=Ctenocephalides felis TaxID=7515 RepID=UPI000E6E120C
MAHITFSIKSKMLHLFAAVMLIILFNEYLIYYLIQFKCNWPNVTEQSHNQYIKALILSDTHLLGKRKGHWFDKLRREWQMHRAFQTAIALHNPEVVFILGDIFDEGLWANKEEFNEYHKRFNDLFKLPKNIEMYVVAGNHDIGFHYEIFKSRAERFSITLNAPPVRIITLKNVHFVLINSMAMEGDGCFLCRQAENLVYNISETLKCWEGVVSCDKVVQKKHYSRPILMQHFPLYRKSDALCNEWDSLPTNDHFREKWDCLSKESTQFLKNTINFREAWSGHTHQGCIYQHWENPIVYEYTVASFSWRNRNDPSYILALFSVDDTLIYKCAMPTENTVINIYILSSFVIILCLITYFYRS